MRCGAFAKRISAYLEGELGRVDRERMDRHLRLCRRCAESLEGVRRVRTSLQALSRVPVSPAFSLELRSRMRWLSARPRTLRGRVSAFVASAPSLPAFAAFGAAAVLGGLLLFGDLRREDAPTILELPPPSESKVAQEGVEVTNYVLWTVSPLELDRAWEDAELSARDAPSEGKASIRQVVF